jgi:UDP-glucose 4-epimerase
MRYLVTGGAGFIGSHLVDLLISRGHHVVAFDNLSTGKLSNVQHLADHERFRFVLGSVLDEAAVAHAMDGVDRVVHLAAAVGVKLIMEQPVDTIITNVRGTENVLGAATRHGLPVLLASTSEVYGKMMQVDTSLTQLREDGDWVLGPTTKRRWAYACSKAMDEFLAIAYWEEKRLPTITARFFNTVGPRQTGQYGMVVPRFVQKALLHEPIVVHGDGTQTRCFNHVTDAVTAVVSLFESESAVGGVFNIGSDFEVSINELARRVVALAHSSSEIVHVPYESVYPHGFEDMQRRTPCLDLLRSTIDYQPRHTLDSTILSVIEHYQRGGEQS